MNTTQPTASRLPFCILVAISYFSHTRTHVEPPIRREAIGPSGRQVVYVKLLKCRRHGTWETSSHHLPMMASRPSKLASSHRSTCSGSGSDLSKGPVERVSHQPIQVPAHSHIARTRKKTSSPDFQVFALGLVSPVQGLVTVLTSRAALVPGLTLSELPYTPSIFLGAVICKREYGWVLVIIVNSKHPFGGGGLSTSITTLFQPSPEGRAEVMLS